MKKKYFQCYTVGCHLQTSFLTLKLFNQTKHAEMTKIMISLREALRKGKKAKEKNSKVVCSHSIMER